MVNQSISHFNFSYLWLGRKSDFVWMFREMRILLCYFWVRWTMKGCNSYFKTGYPLVNPFCERVWIYATRCVSTSFTIFITNDCSKAPYLKQGYLIRNKLLYSFVNQSLHTSLWCSSWKWKIISQKLRGTWSKFFAVRKLQWVAGEGCNSTPSYGNEWYLPQLTVPHYNVSEDQYRN